MTMRNASRRLLLAFLAAAVCSTARAALPIIVVPNGAVQVRTGTGDWGALPKSGLVKAGQSVRTDKASTAELRFSDGSRVQLAPETVFAIEQTDNQETRFSLGVGKIRAAFAGLLSSRVAIKTPTSVCAVRGTVFEIGVDGSNTDVTMAEGVLEVQDNKGNDAVINSEETMRIGDSGMERAHFVGLSDSHALAAVRPYAVHQEMARDATRKMLEEVRSRELKANEAQLGKDVIDAFGRRVRIEEYLLRPADNSFELLFLSHRSDRFDWGHLIQTFNSAIPDDISKAGEIVNATYFSKTMPANWLTSTEFFATNTVDSIKENIVIGMPVAIDFSGYGAGIGVLYYPSSILYTQVLSSPGLASLWNGAGVGNSADGAPVGPDSRLQFTLSQDYGLTTPGRFTFDEKVPDSVTGLQTSMVTAEIDPTNAGSVASPTILFGGPGVGNVNYDNTNTINVQPSGPNMADEGAITFYPDGSAVAVEKLLVNNDGTLVDLTDPKAFSKDGSYNLEFSIDSNLFTKDIDVLIAPEILTQAGQGTKSADSLTP